MLASACPHTHIYKHPFHPREDLGSIQNTFYRPKDNGMLVFSILCVCVCVCVCVCEREREKIQPELKNFQRERGER